MKIKICQCAEIVLWNDNDNFVVLMLLKKLFPFSTILRYPSLGQSHHTQLSL